jgi:transposase
MTSKTTNKFSPEVRTRAVRMVLDHAGEHPSRWAAVTSIAAKIGCTPQTLHDWVKKAEVDSGQRAGVPTDMAEKLKALERENRELRQANEILRKARNERKYLRSDETKTPDFSALYGTITGFGTQGSQVQILPLRP